MSGRKEKKENERPVTEEKIRADAPEKDLSELREEIEKLKENQERLREEHDRRFAEQDRKFEVMREASDANSKNVAYFMSEMYFSLEDLKTLRVLDEARRKFKPE